MSGALQSGSSISHYRVISPLGSGGMGEVYMAQDESLERAVALKILPPELVRNEERVRRFIQEAKSASSLSHPHIVTIYEIGRAEVRAEGGAEGAAPAAPPIHFIAMELITGETLKHTIHQEQADLRVLLRYLAQAAEGLAKAHAAGIVHRDLKPENIMVTKDGYAKILDFGLAKLTERQVASADLTSAPTSAPTATREGTVMGTVGYMSPEQVQGKVVDHRSDVFSFGCILYEAATRRKPFVADSDIETMHLILRDAPVAIEQVNSAAPALLRRLIRRCLEKSPDRRYQSMKDVSIELGNIVDEYDELSASSSSMGSQPSGATAPIAARRGGLRRALLIAGVVAALVVAGGLAVGIVALRQRGARARQASTESFQSMKMNRLTTSGRVAIAALSPDGKYLASATEEGGRSGLWVKQVATGSDVRILPPQEKPVRGLIFSPDGNYLYYVKQETSGPGYSILFQVPTLGGTPRKLIFDVDTTVTFSPDARQIAFVRGYPLDKESVLLVAAADGTGERRLAARRDVDGFALIGPSWSPDGKTIATVATSSGGGLRPEIVLVDVKDGSMKPLGAKRWEGINSLAWLPDGSGLALAGTDQQGVQSTQVWFLSVPDGRARRISNDLNVYVGITVTADSRTLATTQTNLMASLFVVPVSGKDEPRQLTTGTGREDAVGDVSAAPDGSVLFNAAQNGVPAIWSLSADGASRTRISPEGAFSGGAQVSRSGNLIVFAAIRDDGVPHVWTMDRDGGNARQVTNGPGEFPRAVSPDGRWLLYGVVTDNTLLRVPAAGGEPTIVARDIVGAAKYSPDGSRIAFEFYKRIGDRVVRTLGVIPAEGGALIREFPYPDGFDVQFSPAGDALTYSLEQDGIGNLWSQPLAGGPPRPITSFKSGKIFSYDWAPDGKSIFLARGDTTRDVVLITDFR